MSKKKLGIVALLAALALVLPLSVAAQAVDTPLNIPLNNNVAQIGEDCPNDTSVAWWHFVISPNNGHSEFITFHLNLGDATTYDTSIFDPNGIQLDNVFVAVPAGKTITSLITAGSTADIIWDGIGQQPAKFQLSHVCPAGHEAETSAIVTTVHLGATDGQVPTVVDNANPAALGDSVHDSALLTFTGGGELPAGSTVTFFFFTNNNCDGDPADSSAPIGVSGLSPITVDPALVEGPLQAGEYSYTANFLSGDETMVASSAGECEPFTVDKGDTETVTTLVRDDTLASLPISPVPHLPLGTSVHDTAVVNGQVGSFAITGDVTYHFYVGSTTCEDAKLSGSQTVTIDASGLVPDSSSTGALGAGDYSFNAEYLGDGPGGNYNASGLSVCEPFKIDQGVTTTVTQVLDKDGNDVTGTTVPNGSVVHDSADVGPAVAGFPITGTVDYYFSSNGCAGPFTLFDGAVPVGTDSKDTAALTPGSYAFYAVYSGDPNYAGSTGECEPFNVRTFGYTMGFWGNTNGQALLAANDAFSPANAVTIGINSATRCFVTVDSAGKSTTIFPNTLNGQLTIPQCDTTGERDAINTGSFNVVLSQTLAISYNIKYKAGYAGQTISGMGCTAVSPLTSSFDGQSGLSGTSTVENVRDYANRLIGQSIKNNGSLAVTQGQIGAMNTLLGCLNRES